MEEKQQVRKFHEVSRVDNRSISRAIHKSLIKSRIKAMHNKIFWVRNNSDSSLQKIFDRESEHPFDKIQQQRQLRLRDRIGIGQLVKKLSLPKIRGQSGSLHNYPEKKNMLLLNQYRKTMIFNNQQIQARNKKKAINKLQIDEVLQKYSKRCQQQLQNFQFSSNFYAQKMIKSRSHQKKKKRDQKKCSEQFQESSDLPQTIVNMLRKYIR